LHKFANLHLGEDNCVRAAFDGLERLVSNDLDLVVDPKSKIFIMLSHWKLEISASSWSRTSTSRLHQ